MRPHPGRPLDAWARCTSTAETKKKKCRHWESHPGYRRHKPRYCSYTIAANLRRRLDVGVLQIDIDVGKNALAGNQTRVSSVAGMYTITVLPAKNIKSSPTGTRTRVVWVKTTYPDQLDYWGLRRPGIKPGSRPWQGRILSLYYRRIVFVL